MADHRTQHWYPTAAYLYTLHLDGPALAWEYLRRNSDYRRDWLRRRRRGGAARHWGLRLLEDPALDARDAHPVWFPDPDTVLQLYPDEAPPPDAEGFAFWRLPGTKYLIHDGKRLVLVIRWPGCTLRLTIASGLKEGMAYVHAFRASTRLQVLATGLRKLAAAADADALPVAVVQPRPSRAALQELHTLQALDAILAGASLRDVAVGLFGTDAVAVNWHADSD